MAAAGAAWRIEVAALAPASAWGAWQGRRSPQSLCRAGAARTSLSQGGWAGSLAPAASFQQSSSDTQRPGVSWAGEKQRVCRASSQGYVQLLGAVPLRSEWRTEGAQGRLGRQLTSGMLSIT